MDLSSWRNCPSRRNAAFLKWESQDWRIYRAGFVRMSDRHRQVYCDTGIPRCTPDLVTASRGAGSREALDQLVGDRGVDRGTKRGVALAAGCELAEHRREEGAAPHVLSLQPAGEDIRRR